MSICEISLEPCGHDKDRKSLCPVGEQYRKMALYQALLELGKELASSFESFGKIE